MTIHKIVFLQGELIVFDRSEKALAVMESYKSSWETYTTMVKFSTFIDKDEVGFVRALLRLLRGKGNDEREKSCMLVQILEKMITSFLF